MNNLQTKKRAMLMAADQWFLPYGISWDDLIAVYQFKGADSLEASKHDISEHGYDLTYSGAAWDAANGLKSGTITQAALAARTDIVTQVIYYSNYSWGGDWNENGVVAVTNLKYKTSGTPMMCLRMAFSQKIHGDDTSYNDFVNEGHWGAILSNSQGSNSSGDYTTTSYLTAAARLSSSGVIALDKTAKKLYLDGAAQSTTRKSLTSWNHDAGSSYAEGTNPVYTSYAAPYAKTGTMYILAAAFLSVSLTEAQHLSMANGMKNIV